MRKSVATTLGVAKGNDPAVPNHRDSGNGGKPFTYICLVMVPLLIHHLLYNHKNLSFGMTFLFVIILKNKIKLQFLFQLKDCHIYLCNYGRTF